MSEGALKRPQERSEGRDGRFARPDGRKGRNVPFRGPDARHHPPRRVVVARSECRLAFGILVRLAFGLSRSEREVFGWLRLSEREGEAVRSSRPSPS